MIGWLELGFGILIGLAIGVTTHYYYLKHRTKLEQERKLRVRRRFKSYLDGVIVVTPVGDVYFDFKLTSDENQYYLEYRGLSEEGILKVKVTDDGIRDDERLRELLDGIQNNVFGIGLTKIKVLMDLRLKLNDLSKTIISEELEFDWLGGTFKDGEWVSSTYGKFSLKDAPGSLLYLAVSMNSGLRDWIEYGEALTRSVQLAYESERTAQTHYEKAMERLLQGEVQETTLMEGVEVAILQGPLKEYSNFKPYPTFLRWVESVEWSTTPNEDPYDCLVKIANVGVFKTFSGYLVPLPSEVTVEINTP